MSSLEKVILDILDTQQPDTVKELVTLVQEQVDVTLEDIQKEVKRLHQKGLVSLEEPKQNKQTLIEYLSPQTSKWFWITIAVSVLSFLSILLFPETSARK